MAITTNVDNQLEGLGEWAHIRRTELLRLRSKRSAELPLRFWNQQAHFTTPASGTPEKAIRGLAPVPKLLDKFGIGPDDIAARTGVPVAALNAILESGDTHSPFVMVDVEDAVALNTETIAKARAGAIRSFTEENWGRTLPFFRPSGLRLDTCVDDMLAVLGAVARGCDAQDFPVAGIVWPKVEHPEEIVWVCDLLAELEENLGLQKGQIRVEFLVESGHALANLKDLTMACIDRLAGIIWGIADYAADTNLPRIENNHPLCDWARYEIVNLAGAVNVPCIDNMTLNYPTPVHRGAELTDKQMAENKDKILGALQQVYEDALHGIDLGMTGKWVGHPLQLLMVMAAYRNAIPEEQITKDVSEIEAYTASVAKGTGATVLGEGAGSYMADRATDRHLRARLRRATAWGVLPPDRALALGVIDEAERAQL